MWPMPMCTRKRSWKVHPRTLEIRGAPALPFLLSACPRKHLRSPLRALRRHRNYVASEATDGRTVTRLRVRAPRWKYSVLPGPRSAGYRAWRPGLYQLCQVRIRRESLDSLRHSMSNSHHPEGRCSNQTQPNLESIPVKLVSRLSHPASRAPSWRDCGSALLEGALARATPQGYFADWSRGSRGRRDMSTRARDAHLMHHEGCFQRCVVD
mmetsp:Transcript_2386/g.7687  ORF Transcript_2386/g.7687 Transcript_2386/m.7687 type:complete len:210 (-) Transcript_2386:51-680(-)